MKLFLLAFTFAATSSSTLAAVCQFHNTNMNGYSCRLVDGVFTNPNDPFIIEGEHFLRRTDDDV